MASFGQERTLSGLAEMNIYSNPKKRSAFL